jgi:glutathione peroxidase
MSAGHACALGAPQAHPCNQFGAQEPGAEDAIGAFCQKNYGVTFPMFAKIEVNGASAHPLYKYLKDAKPGLLGTEAIKWNFTKFLIGRDGVPVARYTPNTKPEDLEKPVEDLLCFPPPQAHPVKTPL